METDVKKMRIREAYCTDGKTRKFRVHDDYKTLDDPNKQEWFKIYPNSKACVLYTKVKADSGHIVGETAWGTPYIEPYDNGLIGYQGGHYFDTIEEAEKQFEMAKGLSPKVGTLAYADVFMVINPDIDKK